jgi:hypothetical protein
MEKLSRHQSEKCNSWKSFEKECHDCMNDPLELIAKLTVKVGDVSTPEGSVRTRGYPTS